MKKTTFLEKQDSCMDLHDISCLIEEKLLVQLLNFIGKINEKQWVQCLLLIKNYYFPYKL